MKLDSFLQILMPKDKKIFELFEEASANLAQGAKALRDAMNESDPDLRFKFMKKVETIEHNGDDITHRVFHELGSNFITPFDREDIHYLARAVDDVLDNIHGSTKRINLYHVVPNEDMRKLADLIVQCTEELQSAIFELRNMKRMRNITDALVRINSIENHADEIYDSAVARLFEEEKDAINLIKIKEILQALETATDKCEDAANVIESLIIKMA